jgi:hypothetical protein
MLEDRPLHSVTVNGVTFHTGDIEALIIAAYNRSGADMIGGRCNDKEVERDEQGRATSSDCRDTNAGTFHLIMTNYLGLNNTAFAEDRTYDYEVWNQPVVAFEVTELDEITLAEAAEKVGQALPATPEGEEAVEAQEYAYNEDAKFFFKVSASLTYITESHASTEPADQGPHERTDRYTYVLELDGERNIIGGEWTGYSRKKHPDFLWNPRRAWRSAVPNLDLETIRDLIKKAREPVGPEPAPTPAEPMTFSAEGETSIPDGDEAGTAAELAVPFGVRGPVTARVTIKHESAVDLMVGLMAPNGEKWEILAQGTATGENFETAIVLDPAPVGDLGGTWRLLVSDRLENHVGVVSAFSLTVDAPTE